MSRLVGITFAAILVSVTGGIGLSLAHTPNGGFMGLALFKGPPAHEDYVSSFGAVPVLPSPDPVRTATRAPIAHADGPASTTRDIAPSEGTTWALPRHGTAPSIAIRPKARATDRVASNDAIILNAYARDHGRAVQPQPKALPKRARKNAIVSRQRMTQMPRVTARTSAPTPDFLIGVYR